MSGSAFTPEVSDISAERATNRFHQIRVFEQQLRALQRRIDDREADIKVLKEQHDALLEQLLAAARDEADLPLFPWGPLEVGS